LGVPPHRLADMPEADFAEAQHYAATHLLPWRRLEIMLAKIACQVALHRGVKDVTPLDFMIRMQEAADDQPPVTTEEARAAIGFKPTGKRRKKVH
jgi:hypothetical protein